MSRHHHRRIVIAAWTALAVAAAALLVPRPAAAGPTLGPQRTSHPECELPGPSAVGLQPIQIQPGAGGTIPLIEVPPGMPDLVITCMSLDRQFYVEGMPFVATLVVQNFGSGPADSFSVALDICRHVAEGPALTCGGSPPEEDPSGGPIPSSGAELVVSIPQGWSGIIEDPGDSSAPPAGRVYIRAHLTYFVMGVGYVVSNTALAQAVYPSAPASNDFAADADGDGWSPADGDCNDGNPGVNPWHPEIIGNGIDDDCVAGDASPTADCPGGWVYPFDVFTCRPPEQTSDYPADRDADGSPAAASIADLPPISGPGDCDDFNSAIHPGAPETLDTLDNNCNGLIDEGFGTPDWTINSFTVTRDTGPIPLYPDFPWTWGSASLQGGGLQYQVILGNVGEEILGDLSVIQAVRIEIPFAGGVIATGTEGFIPYTSFAGGVDYACSLRSLIAVIDPTGIYGEVNFANNTAIANLEDIGGPDRDLRFASAPSFYVSAPDDFLVYSGAESVGDCPSGPFGDDGSVHVRVRRRISIEGEPIYDETLAPLGYTLGMGLDEPLHVNDRLCLEITLDPENDLAEIDELNNDYVQLFEFKNPVIGPPRFDLVDAYSDGPGATCQGGEAIEPIAGGVAAGALTSRGGLSGIGGLLGGLGGALILGAAGAGLGFALQRALSLSGAAANAAVAGAALVGIAGGAVAGAGVIERLSAPPIPPTIEAPPLAQAGLPSCDLYLDPTSADPAEGTVFQGGDRLILDLEPATAPDEPFSAAFFLRLIAPSGEAVVVRWEADPATGDPLPLDAVAATFGAGADVLAETGTFQWSIDRGVAQIEGELFGGLCQGSTAHTFSIGAASVVEPPRPSDTPRPGVTPPTSTQTATPTRTRTPVPPSATVTPTPDLTGPSIKSVAHNPASLHESDPKGCTNTTALVTASITDPSGIASASVIYFHTTIGQVSMTNAGGNTWQATLGPFPDVGDGTVDYQVRATDGEGNTSDSAFSAIPILACLP